MKITGGDLSMRELKAYRKYVKENKPGHSLVGVHIDGDYVDLELVPVPFERIRRITGYLAPVKSWNGAKRAELVDRVSHDGIKEDNNV